MAIDRDTARASGCDGKKPHLSFTHADRAARPARRAWHTAMQPYRCRLCQSWHLWERPKWSM